MIDEQGFTEPKSEDIFRHNKVVPRLPRKTPIAKQKPVYKLMDSCQLIDPDIPFQCPHRPSSILRPNERSPEVYVAPDNHYCYTTRGGLPLYFPNEEQVKVKKCRQKAPMTMLIMKPMLWSEERLWKYAGAAKTLVGAYILRATCSPLWGAVSRNVRKGTRLLLKPLTIFHKKTSTKS